MTNDLATYPPLATHPLIDSADETDVATAPNRRTVVDESKPATPWGKAWVVSVTDVRGWIVVKAGDANGAKILAAGSEIRVRLHLNGREILDATGYVQPEIDGRPLVGLRAGRVVLVDLGEDDGYVTALHYGDDGHWARGNYHIDEAEAREDFETRAAKLRAEGPEVWLNDL